MAQQNVQVQHTEQQLTQQQSLTAQHVLLVKLLELPLDALQRRIDDECLENPWLEKQTSSDETDTSDISPDEGSTYDPADDYRSEDDIPTYLLHQSSGKEPTMESIEYGETLSFYDHLKEQASEFDLDERQRLLLDYLIGSLEEDGLLKKKLRLVVDELAIYQGIDTTEEELLGVLHVLWQFDPPGIGARSLQECLLLQAERDTANPLQQLMVKTLKDSWDDFTHKRWNAITRRLHLTAAQASALQRELLRLNPRPGAALGELTGRSTQQITPDFIVENDGYGNLTLSLNNAGIPDLVISADATDTLSTYAQQKGQLSQAAREEVEFTRRYVDRGQLFINAMRQRRETMLRTMTAIMHIQRDFFLDGDEAQLHPMILDDVAQRTGLDFSTVSRVANSKYVQTPYGTFPLKWFFTQRAIQHGDETLSARQVMVVLRELIDSEDKSNPLPDERLAQLMQQRGYDIARRTIAKYREQMGIPVARMRREL